MNDPDESRIKLLQELSALHRRVAELEAEETQQQQAEEILQKRREAQQVALHRVWEKVWKMRGVEDIDQVLSTLGPVLTAREISFLAYSINLVVAPEGEPPVHVYIHDPDGRQFLAPLQRDQAETRVILEAWRSGNVLYRPDLAKENIYGEHLRPPQQPHHARVRSAIDIPFSRGTLSLASARPGACSEEDISFLKDLAQVVEGGFQRAGDLQRLEQRNQTLTDEIAERKRAEEALRQAKEEALRLLWREAAMGRLRDRILALRHLSEFPRELEEEWVKELRGLGIPIWRVSLQMPASREGYFATFRSILLQSGPSGDARLADYPWVKEVWETGKPVVVDRQRLERAGFQPEVQALTEVPLPGGGSLGVNSQVPGAFDAEAVHTLEVSASLIAEGVQRLQDFETLRQAEEGLRVNLALQQVRNEILQMQGEEDWKKVTSQLHRELSELVEFEDCGINLLDRRHRHYLAHEMTLAGDFREKVYEEPLPRALVQALDTGKPVYRHRRAEIDQFEDLVEAGKNCVLDVPFSGGTVAINSSREEAFSERDIQVLEQFAQVMSEAHRRLDDLKQLAVKETQLRQAQKMESVGRLAGGVAHDFNNQLTVISGLAQMALGQTGISEPLRQDLQEMLTAAQHSADLTRQLLAFARQQTIRPKVLDLNDTVSDLLKMLRRLIGEGIDLAWLPGHSLWPVEVDPGQIDQILANLVVNARDAISGIGKVTIETATVEFDEAYCQTHVGSVPGQYVILAVSDDGCGMDEQTQAQIFEPFFTTKGAGEGTGLGLSTVYGIVKQNDGFINVYSEPGQGTTFRIYLPRFAAEAAETPTEGVSEALPGGHETVLIVEDQAAVLKLARKMLEGLGYTVLTVGTPGEALRLAETHAGEIDLLLTDVVLPEMNGRELAQRFAAVRPGSRCLFMSGYTADTIAHHGVLEEKVHFLQKPFSLEALAAELREVLAGQ